MIENQTFFQLLIRIEIQELQKIVKSEIDCDTAFNETAQKTTKQGFLDFQNDIKGKETTYKVEDFNLYLIECFETYKKDFENNRNHDKADDYIHYLKAKQSKSREDFQTYLEKYEYKGGLNVEQVHDGLLFLDAFEKETIEALVEYLKNSELKEFELDAERAIKAIEKAIKVDMAFNDIQNFEGEVDEGIKLCNEFLRDNRGHNKEYDKFVADKKSVLTYERDEDKDCKNAMKDGSEEALLEYLKEHGKNGRNYKVITKLLREKQLGVTEKDKDVLNTVKDLALQMEKSNNDNSQVVTDLMEKFSVQMEKSNNDNSQVVTDLMEKFSVQMEKSNNDNSQNVTQLIQSFSTQIVTVEEKRGKEQRVLYIILGILGFIFLTTISIVILSYMK